MAFSNMSSLCELEERYGVDLRASVKKCANMCKFDRLHCIGAAARPCGCTVKSKIL